MHRVLIAVSPAHTTRSCSFLCHVQPRLQKQQQSQLPTGPVGSSQSVTVFTSPHHNGKSYCLQILSPLKTAVLDNTLFCSLLQFNTLYANLNMGFSNYLIHLDQFNMMLLEKIQAERTAED